MASRKVEDIILIVLILQIACIERCQAYSYSYPWWSMWYFWVIMFGVIACCFGAWGSYYRKRMLARAATGRRPHYVIPATNSNPHVQQPYVTGALPPQTTSPPTVYVPPPYPVGVATQPPAYSEGSTNPSFQQNEQETKKDNLPPAYSDLYGSGQSNIEK